MEGFWQTALPALGMYDAIFFDDFPVRAFVVCHGCFVRLRDLFGFCLGFSYEFFFVVEAEHIGKYFLWSRELDRITGI